MASSLNLNQGGSLVAQAGPNRWLRGWRQLRRNKLALVGAVVTIAFLFIGAFGPSLVDNSYSKQNLMATFKPPGTEGHLLGTDDLGRDMLARLAMGIRISLIVGFGVTAMAMAVGMFLGGVAGFVGGKTDTVISGVVEFTWGFPLILIAVILTGAMGPGLWPVIISVGLINWAGIARVVRGEVLALRDREYVEAARTVGLTESRILFRHVIPNVVGPAIVMASYMVALAIIIEAGLSFIGMGAQPPLPSLGTMIANGRNYLQLDHWIATIPGLAIVVIVVSLNVMGDGLRDFFDPRLHR